MYLDEIIKLPEQVATLPEVGSISYQAASLSVRAVELKSKYASLLMDRDVLMAEIHELWTREERKEAGL